MSGLWDSLFLSLRVALCATVLAALVAIPLAFLMTRWRFWGKSLVEAVFTLPLVLPPTVVGYYLIVVWGRRGFLGEWLDKWFDYSLMFNWHGAVLAACTVSMPLAFICRRSAFAAADRELGRCGAALWGQCAANILARKFAVGEQGDCRGLAPDIFAGSWGNLGQR